MNEKLFKIIAVLCLIREKNHREHKEFWGATAYANAYDWICYALEGRDDCLSQFDGFEEAEKFLNEHPNFDSWELEEIFRED